MNKELPVHYHMTIATIDRRHYPVSKLGNTSGENPSLSTIMTMSWDYSIPHAQGKAPTHGTVSFHTRKEALAFCHRKWEEYQLTVKWEGLRARSELHPDRNAWYREELMNYACSDPIVGRIVDTTYARMHLWDGTPLEVDGETIDEVYVKLYEAACQYAASQEEVHLCATPSAS